MITKERFIEIAVSEGFEREVVEKAWDDMPPDIPEWASEAITRLLLRTALWAAVTQAQQLRAMRN